MHSHNGNIHKGLKGQFLKFFPPPQLITMPTVGIDISDVSIRFLELVTKHDNIRVGRFGTAVIEEGIVVQGKIKDAKRLTEELKKLKEEHSLAFVNISLPEEKSYLFQTTISKIAPGQSVRSVLEFKLEEHIPISARDAIFDYEILTKDQVGNMVLSVAAYSRETINDYVFIFKSAGLTPHTLEIETQSTARSVVPDSKGTYMIVDFGHARTGVAVVSRGTLRFTSTVLVGGEGLTAAIKKHLPHLDEAGIIEIKNKKGLSQFDTNKALFEDLMKEVKSLRDEIDKRYIYWNTRSTPDKKKAPAIDKIILCGGSSNLAGLADYLSNSIKIPVEIANVWENVLSFEDAIPPIDKRHSLAYATSIGLALQNLTLERHD